MVVLLKRNHGPWRAHNHTQSKIIDVTLAFRVRYFRILLTSPRGVPAYILKYLEQEAFELSLSEEILEQYKAALRYEQVKKAHKLSNEQITRVLMI